MRCRVGCCLPASRFPLHAQNATSGGDQRAQPDDAGWPAAVADAEAAVVCAARVTGVSGTSVMLKTEQGEAWTVISTDNTRVRARRADRAPSPRSKQAMKLWRLEFPTPDKHEVHAVMLVAVSAAEVAKAKANLGKTYIVGRITAINDTQLTIMRTDRVSQVISLDETTSLHKGGRMSPEAMAAGRPEHGGAWRRHGRAGGMGGGGGRRAANADAPAADPGEAITLADVKSG